MKESLFCILFSFFSMVGMSQSSSGGGVFISDEIHREPVATALLELSSSKKGVLIPRMTYENMRAINSPADGLFVFVVSSIEHGISSRGFYFFDKVMRNDWVKIESKVEKKYQAEPVGTIVGFSGKLNYFFNSDGSGIVGTEYEGWKICNGANGTPDLTDRFLVGAASITKYGEIINEKMLGGLTDENLDYAEVRSHESDYDIIGKSSGDQSQILLKPYHLPIHKHKPKQIQIIQLAHSHEIEVLTHFHAYERATGRSETEKYPQEAKNTGSGEYMPVKETFPDIDTDDNVSLAYRSDMILNINFPECSLEKFGSVNPTEFSNEPKNFILAFIIKTAPSPLVYQDMLRNDIIFEVYKAQSPNPFSMTYFQNNAE